MGRNKGFTLIELLIVILLIGTFITFASVNWGTFGGKGEEGLLETFSINVSLLKEDAVANYESRLVEYNITENTIRMGRMDKKDGFTPTGEFEIAGEYRLKDVVVNGRAYSMGKCYMILHPSGMVDRTVLHFEGKNSFYTLLINPLTAKITGENGYVEEISLRGRGNPS